ncbi:hypothetical protein E2C01_097315 [Portunus trituberculatus]|uniref:Uncharacterized protein n=1 Tax=Portunus trituberculatus TaxID=210409 RepID=A0A5B7JUV5_PORTR|nr:hypothetical protein [Portunus trituberculatus]
MDRGGGGGGAGGGGGGRGREERTKWKYPFGTSRVSLFTASCCLPGGEEAEEEK